MGLFCSLPSCGGQIFNSRVCVMVKGTITSTLLSSYLTSYHFLGSCTLTILSLLVLQQTMAAPISQGLCTCLCLL